MPFAEEHEAEAEDVEQAVQQSGGHHESTTAAAHAESAKNAAKEAMARAVEQIKRRVEDIAAESARNQILRNGVQRRA